MRCSVTCLAWFSSRPTWVSCSCPSSPLVHAAVQVRVVMSSMHAWIVWTAPILRPWWWPPLWRSCEGHGGGLSWSLLLHMAMMLWSQCPAAMFVSCATFLLVVVSISRSVAVLSIVEPFWSLAGFSGYILLHLVSVFNQLKHRHRLLTCVASPWQPHWGLFPPASCHTDFPAN